MISISDLQFSHPFRAYQQRVLDNMDAHLRDGKIHIVAAPGSGKTILGLEIVCRLGEPTLVFSPSITIRQQWADRFESDFLPKGENIDEYISFSIKKPKVITSITYQALHAAIHRKQMIESDENSLDDLNDNETDAEQNYESDGIPYDSEVSELTNDQHNTTIEDYSDFDIFESVNQLGIKTICLDEAHHLRAEWQKALEEFIASCGSDVKIVSLTATPPFDADTNEWERYENLCGPIDEEIFVPELVDEGTLCPHQDFIIANFPAEKEIDVIKRYENKVRNAFEALRELKIMQRVIDDIALLDESVRELLFFDNEKTVKSLFAFARHEHVEIPDEWLFLVDEHGNLPKFNEQEAQDSLQFILDTPEFSKELQKELEKALKTNGVMNRRHVCLIAQPRLNNMMRASTGKLASIDRIALTEWNNRKSDLRMLILTDYIKKECLPYVGLDDYHLDTIGSIPIFETLRRSVGSSANVAVLSGGIIIIPNSIRNDIKQLAQHENVSCSFSKLPCKNNIEYCICNFGNSSRTGVRILTNAFEQGLIHIMIGTKSLLGEGWDAPCNNSLILASFVGSFMLSNQMRGRAIRIDKNNPSKVSTIWHLVTIRPPILYDDENLQSYYEDSIMENEPFVGSDLYLLRRRFDCFVGPDYNEATIRSGLERIRDFSPPYTRERISSINDKMLERACDTDVIRDSWKNALDVFPHGYTLSSVSEIKRDPIPKKFIFIDYTYLFSIAMFYSILAFTIYKVLPLMATPIINLSILPIVLIVIIVSFSSLHYLQHRKITSSPKRTLTNVSKALLEALVKVGEISSPCPRVIVENNPTLSYFVINLENATRREKTVFTKATTQLFSNIDNPRYVLVIHDLPKIIKKKKPYFMSMAVPDILCKHRKDADIFASVCKEYGLGDVKAIYVNNKEGRKILWQCRRQSYFNLTERAEKKFSKLTAN